jgi:hypothetical protein
MGNSKRRAHQLLPEQLPRVRPRLLEGYSALTGLVDVALVNGLQPDRPRLISECLAVERLFRLRPRCFGPRLGIELKMSAITHESTP